MKKRILLFSALLLITSISFSQITITGSDLPQAGYTYFVDTDTTPSISLGIPGPGTQSWNFSSLVSDYPGVPTYGMTSWTPYTSAFPTSNTYTYGPAALYSNLAGGAPVSSQGMNNGYMFWKSDNTGFWAVGFRADSGTYANQNIVYSSAELLIGAPCTYGNTFNNNARWELPMDLNAADVDTYYVCRTVKTISCDAWGSLTTPFGNFPNIIRQHEYVIRYDSVYAKFAGNVVSALELLRDTSNNYIYLSNTINYPVSMVHADVNNTVKRVEWYSGVITAISPDAELNSELKIFPNPVNEAAVAELKLKQAEEVEIYLSDVLGKSFVIVPKQKLAAGNHSYSVRTENFPAGVYSLIVSTRSDATLQKVIIIH